MNDSFFLCYVICIAYAFSPQRNLLNWGPLVGHDPTPAVTLWLQLVDSDDWLLKYCRGHLHISFPKPTHFCSIPWLLPLINTDAPGAEKSLIDSLVKGQYVTVGINLRLIIFCWVEWRLLIDTFTELVLEGSGRNFQEKQTVNKRN